MTVLDLAPDPLPQAGSTTQSPASALQDDARRNSSAHSSDERLPDAARLRQGTRLTILGAALVTLVHVWVISAGWMTYWPQYTTHYNRLAEAFRRGQCSLLIKPDPILKALPDPYDPVVNKPYRYRPGVHDTVLFKGRLYLYWGPVPALLLLPVKLFVGLKVIGDQYLVFAFTLGTTIFGALLLRDLWGRYFPDVPPWMLLVAMVVAGLSTPIPYTLARAAVYEAAILGGQCFLLAGLYFSCAGAGFPGRRRLALAGTCWALAAGSRVSLAVALIALSLVVAWRIVRHGYRTSGRLDIPRLAALGLPMAVAAVLLGAYNYTRFGNWHEFGQRYQLTGANYNSTPHLFEVANAVPGLFSYFLRPAQIHEMFPFFDAKPGDGTFPRFIRLPEHYEYNEPIAGLLLATPFIWFAVFPVVRLIGAGVARTVGAALAAGSELADASPGPHPSCGLDWALLCLLCASVLGFAPIPFMLGSTMRYLCDLTPCLMILAAVGLWQCACRVAPARAAVRGAFAGVVGVLAVASVCVGLLLGITGYYQHFRHYHRHLFGRISYWAQDPEP